MLPYLAGVDDVKQASESHRTRLWEIQVGWLETIPVAAVWALDGRFAVRRTTWAAADGTAVARGRGSGTALGAGRGAGPIRRFWARAANLSAGTWRRTAPESRVAARTAPAPVRRVGAGSGAWPFLFRA